MKKRILAVVMTAAMVLGALTGCGQSSKDDKTESATAAETETISYDVLTQVRVGYMPNYESLWEVPQRLIKVILKSRDWISSYLLFRLTRRE